MIELVGLDGDDTLWHSESHFADAQATFAKVLEPYTAGDADVMAAHYATERRNLQLFGYGAKGFTLSMIETAIEVTGGRITTAAITQLMELGKSLLDHPVELLPGVSDTVTELAAAGRRLALVTKGDLFHQEQKIARSGLVDLFERVDIVSEKDPDTYRRVVKSAGVEPEHFLMVGNTVRSDVLPVLAIGGQAIQVPYAITWGHEEAEHDGNFPVLETLSALPGWLAEHDR